MTFPPQATKSVSFYHLTTTGGQSQPYSATADVSARCAVLPLDRRDSALIGVDLIEPWDLYCPVTAAILLQDKVTISGDTATYYVKHIMFANIGPLLHQRVTIAKNQ